MPSTSATGSTSYVRTAAGLVLTDPDGTVYSLRTGAAGGEVDVIGATDPRRGYLVGDADGTRAGWVDTSGDLPVFVVADLTDGSVQRLEAPTQGRGILKDEAEPATFFAIDQDTAYWLDDRGAVAVDVVTGDVEVLDPDATTGFDLLGAEDGVVARSAGDAGIRLGEVLLPRVYGSIGSFSPDANWFSVDADDPQVYDVRTGQQVSFDLDAWFATGYEWLDDSTVTMISQETRKTPVQLQTCRVPQGTCEVAAADLGSFDELLAEGFALPVGESMED